jgi:cysteine desulfurase / selenocysteine lyase
VPPTDPLVYLDTAATSFPKPPEMLRGMLDTFARVGVSPGRGSHDLAAQAGQLVDAARRQLARFFEAPDPDRVVFAGNATDALNLAIQGLAEPGDHFVATELDHNSVLRPLHALAAQGRITYDLAPFDDRGFVDPDDVARLIRPNTRAVVMTHASNVLGTIQPVAEVGQLCEARGVPLVVDAAQTAGRIPVGLASLHASAISFTGHKSLCGPPGIGGLVVRPDLVIRTTRFGGTGMDSRSLEHTQAWPFRLEAGTINTIGIIGLSIGVDCIGRQGLGAIQAHELALLERLRDGLRDLPGVRLYCADDLADHIAILTASVEGIDPDDVGDMLDHEFHIAVRVGLHCAPLVHRRLETGDHGAIRFSPGPFTSAEDIDRAIAAMQAIVR